MDVLQNDFLCKRYEHKLNVVLDLDETLIHTFINPTIETQIDLFGRPNFLVHFQYSQMESMTTFYRPDMVGFMHHISKYFNLYIYTNGVRKYCDTILIHICNMLDAYPIVNSFSRREDGSMAKSLEYMGLDPTQTIVVDDHKEFWPNDPDNLIIIKPFMGPILQTNDYIYDKELLKVWGLLISIKNEYESRSRDIAEYDIRNIIKNHNDIYLYFDMLIDIVEMRVNDDEKENNDKLTSKNCDSLDCDDEFIDCIENFYGVF